MGSYSEVDLLVGDVLDIGHNCTLTVMDIDDGEVTFRLDNDGLVEDLSFPFDAAGTSR